MLQDSIHGPVEEKTETILHSENLKINKKVFWQMLVRNFDLLSKTVAKWNFEKITFDQSCKCKCLNQQPLL